MMTTRLRRSFTPEFKAQTVELVRTSGKSVGEDVGGHDAVHRRAHA
jgi:transposase-like protein